MPPITYTGKNKPRGDDIEQWRKYFEVNPDAKDKFPEEYAKVYPPALTPVKKPRAIKQQAPEPVVMTTDKPAKPKKSTESSADIKDIDFKNLVPVVVETDNSEAMLSEKKKQKLIESQYEKLQLLIGKSLWSSRLSAICTIRTVDVKRQTVKVSISKISILDFADIGILGLVDLDGAINSETDKYAKMQLDEAEHIYTLAWREMQPQDDWGYYLGLSPKAEKGEKPTPIEFPVNRKNLG